MSGPFRVTYQPVLMSEVDSLVGVSEEEARRWVLEAIRDDMAGGAAEDPMGYEEFRKPDGETVFRVVYKQPKELLFTYRIKRDG